MASFTDACSQFAGFYAEKTGAALNPYAAAALKQIKAIFFDMDNTLIPTRAGDTRACKKLAELLHCQYNFSKHDASNVTAAFLSTFRRCPAPPGATDVQSALDAWRLQLWSQALPQGCQHLAEELYPQWLQLRLACLQPPKEYVELLQRCRAAGYLLAVITNGPSNAQWEKLRQLQLVSYFDCILVSDDLPWEKPSPHIFHAACNFLGVKPQESAIVGDKLSTDIKGGALAHLGATFWLPKPNADTNVHNMAYAPNVTLDSLLQLYDYFPAIAAADLPAAHTPSDDFNLKRSSSQLSFSEVTTSTCDSEDFWSDHNRKQRRCGSLPNVEWMSSETESSSDSHFS